MSESALRFSVATLGCKVNNFESELIARRLQDREEQSGRCYQRVGPRQRADLCIINTCTVTAEADRQARQLVRRSVRENPGARVVVTGCYAQIDPQACAAIPGVDLVVGNGRKLAIPEVLAQLDGDGGEIGEPDGPPVLVDPMDAAITLPQSQPQSQHLLGELEGRSRAFLQIQQGCDRGCTFCVIHKARGPSRSFPAGMIRRQARELAANGYRELVLCGVDIGAYGEDFPPSADAETEQRTDDGLTNLLRELTTLANEHDFRIRLSSIDPAHITDPLIELIAAEPALCPQLHLSLQSANTLILKRMKRRASREMVVERVGKLRRAVPHLVLGADIMVGFPTESEAHFRDTLEAVDELEIAYPHVFAYSPRPGTPAARIPASAQVPVAERKRRAALVRERGRAVWARVAARQVGARVRVLIEGRDGEEKGDGRLRGRAANYFPVVFDSRRGTAGTADKWAEVEIYAVGEDSLIARRLD